MSVQLRIVHSQWNEIRKAIHETQNKFIIHDNKSPKQYIYPPPDDSEQELENTNSVLFLKDTSRNTRRNFYLAKRRRQLSFIKDQQFYDKIEIRKIQAQNNKILYSNVKSMVKSIQDNQKRELIQNNKITHSTSRKFSFELPKMQVIDTSSKNFWQNLKSPMKDGITKVLRERLNKKNDVKLDYNSFCYESLAKTPKARTPMNNYIPPQLTCDAVCFRQLEGKNRQVLLITRGKEPYVGRYAFPGGHLDYGEDPEQCCLRELMEETGILGLSVDLVDVKGDPQRDPRGHYVTIVYKVEVPENAEPKADDDAATAQWVDLEDILKIGKEQFAFDHFEILQKAAYQKQQ